MVDASGSTGGVAAEVFTVVREYDVTMLAFDHSKINYTLAGQNNCTEATSSSGDIRISTNATAPVSTCDVIHLEFEGGTMPYTASVVALNSGVTNHTLGANDNVLNYVEKLTSGTDFLGESQSIRGNV